MRPWVRVLGQVAAASVVVALKVLEGLLAGDPPPRRRPPLTRLPPPPHLTLEVYRSAMRDDGGKDALSLLDDGLEWAKRWGGETRFGRGPHAPLYLVIAERGGKSVKALCFNTAGETGVLFWFLRTHPPFDDSMVRRDLAIRLQRVLWITMPAGCWDRRTYNVKLDVLRRPDVRAVFFSVFDDVARDLQAPRP